MTIIHFPSSPSMAKCVAAARRCAFHTEWNISSVQCVGPLLIVAVADVVATWNETARAAPNVVTRAGSARAAKFATSSVVNARAVSTANVYQGYASVKGTNMGIFSILQTCPYPTTISQKSRMKPKIGNQTITDPTCVIIVRNVCQGICVSWEKIYSGIDLSRFGTSMS